MGMLELKMTGHRYTWGNRRDGEGFVQEKLDKIFSSLEWHSIYPTAKVAHIHRSSSDHGLLLITLEPRGVKIKKRFYFDRRWLAREGIREVVAEAWGKQQDGTPMFRFQEKVKETRVSLLKWSRNF
ncbi:Unknown protein [Striga hermonthica]|uniref:Uncharacterized protein n=1 Tax=Striga hermonthica TaxID=68872 RepID=A0A9N7NDZ0_STRHE|nr:Unknown protein [Striga hermonthica]